MNFNVYVSLKKSSMDALSDIFKQVDHAEPQIVFIYPTSNHDIESVRDAIGKRWSTAALIGATTCKGFLTQDGFQSNQGWCLAVATYSPENLRVSVGFSQSGDGFNDGYIATEKAISGSDLPGELPDFIWVHSCPGNEEEVIKGIQKSIGINVPIVGGTAADNSIAEEWSVFSRFESSQHGVIVTAFFGKDVFSSFLSGYSPTSCVGTVTEAENRKIIKIDDQFASVVYNDWTDKALGPLNFNIDETRNILNLTSLHPLGRKVDKIGGSSFYLLSHPSELVNGREITLFTSIKEGEQVTLMEGSVKSLQERVGTIVTSLMNRENLSNEDIDGVMLIYCAGCMLLLESQNEMELVAHSVSQALPGKPVAGIFSFGEQGTFPSGSIRHGNLMISITLLCSKKRRSS